MYPWMSIHAYIFSPVHLGLRSNDTSVATTTLIILILDYLSVYYYCHNKVPLKQQEFTASQVWRLENQDQGVARIGFFPQGYKRKSVPCQSLSFCWFTVYLWHSLACRSITPISGFMSTQCSPRVRRVLWNQKLRKYFRLRYHWDGNIGGSRISLLQQMHWIYCYMWSNSFWEKFRNNWLTHTQLATKKILTQK